MKPVKNNTLEPLLRGELPLKRIALWKGCAKMKVMVIS